MCPKGARIIAVDVGMIVVPLRLAPLGKGKRSRAFLPAIAGHVRHIRPLPDAIQIRLAPGILGCGTLGRLISTTSRRLGRGRLFRLCKNGHRGQKKTSDNQTAIHLEVLLSSAQRRGRALHAEERLARGFVVRIYFVF
jgi:hypothetical protein